MNSKTPKYLRDTLPGEFKPRIVSIESRGTDITPADRIDCWDHVRMAHKIRQVDPPVDYPQSDAEVEFGRRKFDAVYWAATVLIIAIAFAAIALLLALISDPVGAGRLVSGDECRYPDFCQIASVKGE